MPVLIEAQGTQNSLTGVGCSICDEGFAPDERMVNSNGQILHERCFM